LKNEYSIINPIVTKASTSAKPGVLKVEDARKRLAGLKK
jgi:hypothetical protein